MRENYNLMIRGDKVTLVPYREEHVAKYHEWMVSLSVDVEEINFLVHICICTINYECQYQLREIMIRSIIAARPLAPGDHCLRASYSTRRV
jgi:hypothetical protein